MLANLFFFWTGFGGNPAPPKLPHGGGLPRKSPHRGWDREAFKRLKKQDDAIEETIRRVWFGKTDTDLEIPVEIREEVKESLPESLFLTPKFDEIAVRAQVELIRQQIQARFDEDDEFLLFYG